MTLESTNNPTLLACTVFVATWRAASRIKDPASRITSTTSQIKFSLTCVRFFSGFDPVRKPHNLILNAYATIWTTSPATRPAGPAGALRAAPRAAHLPDATPAYAEALHCPAAPERCSAAWQNAWPGNSCRAPHPRVRPGGYGCCAGGDPLRGQRHPR